MSERPSIEPRDLGDGLVLRSTTAADAVAVGMLTGFVFRTAPDAPPNPRQLPRTLELASGKHPISGPDHGIVVEDTRHHRLVASMWALPVVWEYDGISFGVGRPEQVVCLPEHRGRGIVRAMFDAFHTQGRQVGELAQAITGISYYYRRYGYEYAIEQERGHVLAFDAITPPASTGYTIRDATPADIPTIATLYDADSRASPVRAVVTPDYWRWTLFDADPATNEPHQASMIVDVAGNVCGFVAYRARRYTAGLHVTRLVVAPDHLLAAISAVLAGLRERATRIPIRDGVAPLPASELLFELGSDHPLYRHVAAFTRIDPPYAWYVRVGDMPAFVAHVGAALERRLARSPFAGYDGTIMLDAYDYGLRLAFKQGTLDGTTAWRPARRPEVGPSPDLALPPFALLQLVFGYRDLASLAATYPDVRVMNDRAAEVTHALFPARASSVFEMN